MAIGEPVWQIAERFPVQGAWTETEYLSLPEGYPRVELCDGRLEVLPMPTDRHQAILTAVLLLFVAYARKEGGWARPAGLRLRLEAGRFREPDVAFLSKARGALRGQEWWSGADVVVEVVSESSEDRERDYVIKRREYAAARIPEYWVVDAQEQRIVVHELHGDEYAEHVFARGGIVKSLACAGVEATVGEILDAE